MTSSEGLRREPAADPDAIYQLLIEAHRDLSAEQSRMLDVRLCLLLANHVGDPAVIGAAIAAARRSVLGDEPAAGAARSAG